MWRTVRIREEAYNYLKELARKEKKSMCEIVSRIVLEHMKAEKNQSENQSNFQLTENITGDEIALVNKTSHKLKATLIVEGIHTPEWLYPNEFRTCISGERLRRVKYTLVLEEDEWEKGGEIMSRSEKLLKIEKNKQGRINYYYNRQQGKDPTNLLSISDDGTIYIMKSVISSPDVAIALISALKHAVTLMRGGESFAPVLDDYVQLFEDIWYEEYVKSV